MANPLPHIESFFDPATFTVSHVLACPVTRRAALIDPVLDYDPKSGRTATHNAEKLLAVVQAQGLQVEWLLETHAHADHLSAAPWLQQRVGGRIGIGAGIGGVQQRFARLLDAPDLSGSGQEFDQLFADGEHFQLGELDIEVMATPGHTPACVSYRVGQHVFVGDTLFMPDYGSARADFPGGNARELYRSIQKLLALPPDTQLHLCHDYPPASRAPAWTCTVAEQRAHNVQVHEGVDEASYVAMREARDATLAAPVLLWPSLQVNLRAGHFPPANSEGLVHLKTPINVL
ncbi:MAG: MBL fold metallo-hydrolase [Burkholderiales bacterium]|jgi:glyoxylase-like metal-dependent hydrolase (beta-lactamase superfamily II)